MRRPSTKARQNRQADAPEGAASVRLADVLTFLEIYAKADTAKAEDRANFSKLLSSNDEKKGLTTRIGQLERIVTFLYGKDEAERTGLHRLFEKDHVGALVPSADARLLHKHFVILRDVYRNIKAELQEEHLASPTPVLRIGVPPSIGMRLLAAIFSDRKRLFSDKIRLEVEMGTSHDLIRRMKARLLDVVIAYGANKPGTVDSLFNLAYRSLGYRSSMVLLCSPTARLWTTAQKNVARRDVNQGYWENKYQNKTRYEFPSYEDLCRINLETIDFATTRLIVVPSWHQPQALDALARHFSNGQVTQVPWYEEALALVRMGEGVAVMPEVFLRSARITAFRLIPEKQFERWIGAYFHPPEKRLPEHIRWSIKLIEKYLESFEQDIRRGDAPAFGHPKYNEFCDSVILPGSGSNGTENRHKPSEPQKTLG
jgi:DNA-binding transcriptional LysR family regulator